MFHVEHLILRLILEEDYKDVSRGTCEFDILINCFL